VLFDLNVVLQIMQRSKKVEQNNKPRDLKITISFDRDHLNIILMLTITASIANSLNDGTRIVFNISLTASKSSARSMPVAKRNLIVSLACVCSLVDLVNILRNENSPSVEIPIIKPAATSIPKVMY
jgi:hypothetical protein